MANKDDGARGRPRELTTSAAALRPLIESPMPQVRVAWPQQPAVSCAGCELAMCVSW